MLDIVFPCCQREVASLLPVDIGDEHDLFVDAVRNFVNEYSVRSPSGVLHGSSAYDTGGVIRLLVGASRGTEKPPHLLCSSRANARHFGDFWNQSSSGTRA